MHVQVWHPTLPAQVICKTTNIGGQRNVANKQFAVNCDSMLFHMNSTLMLPVTLWSVNIAMDNDPVIVDLPINSMVNFHSFTVLPIKNGDFLSFFVCLPEAT